jgi:hypothetical protein
MTLPGITTGRRDRRTVGSRAGEERQRLVNVVRIRLRRAISEIIDGGAWLRRIDVLNCITCPNLVWSIVKGRGKHVLNIRRNTRFQRSV